MTWASRSTIYERSPAELVQRGAGIGFLPETLPIPGRACRRAAGPDQRRHLAHPVSGPARRVVHLRRHHRYRFSSWNTVYRQMLALLRPRPLPPGRRDDRLGRSATMPSRSDLANETTRAGRPAGLRRRGRLDRAGARCCRTCEPVYAGYVAWRGMVPEASLDSATRAAGRRRDHLLRLRQQPHPRLPDTRARTVRSAPANA